MEFVDLRSDTVTHQPQPCAPPWPRPKWGMMYLEKTRPINRLQEAAAERMGKEAGLFVPSGTMGNLAAILTHCSRGDEAIMGDLGHTFLFEGGGVAALGGVHPHTLPNQPDGTLRLEDIRGAIRVGGCRISRSPA